MVSTILTPISLWKDFVINCSFKESFLNELECDGVIYKNLYFSGMTTSSGEVRIFAVYAEPKFNKTDKCVILVGDPSFTCDFEKIRFFSSMGYSVLMPDLRGGFGDGNFTRYPSDINFSNYNVCKDDLNLVEDTVKGTPWYSWACVVRYSVEFAKSVLKAASIALVGIKRGADVCWMSINEEVDCFVDMYGAGWNGYKGAADDDVLSEQRRKFIAGIDAESYAQYVDCPVLFLTATNNPDFDCERCNDTLLRVQGEKFFMFSAGYRYFLSQKSFLTMERFLEKYLAKDNVAFYNSPSLSVTLKDDNVKFDVGVDKNSSIKSIWLYVCCGEGASFKKNWRSFKLGKQTSLVVKKSEFYDVINAFVSVKSEDGLSLCSSIVKLKLVGATQKSLSKSISSADNSDNAFSCLTSIGKIKGGLFHESEAKVETLTGPFGIMGVYSESGLISYKLNDFSACLDDSVMVKFDIFCPNFTVATVGIETESDGVFCSYRAEISVKGANVWQNFCEELSAFKDENGKSIKDYSTVYAITFYSEEKFLLTNLILF